MTDTARGYVAVAADTIGDDNRQWIEVVPTANKVRNGVWAYTLDRADLEDGAAYLQANPDRIAIDYNHQTADGGDSVAAGWFTGQAEVVDDPDRGPILRAEVEWTPEGAADVKNKRYRFISAEWKPRLLDVKAKVLTGIKQVLAATLTNRPLFTELAALAAVVWTTDAGLEQTRDLLNRALNPGSLDQSRFWVMDVAIDGERALVREYASSKTWVVPFTIAGDAATVAAEADWTEAEQEWVAATAEAMQKNLARKPFNEKEITMPENMSALAKALGLAEDADETAIAAAIKARDDKIVELEGKVLPEDEVKNLVAQAAEGAQAKKDLDEMKVESLLADAVRDGKILPTQKDAYATMARADFAGVKALIDATPEKALAHLAETGSGDGDDNDGTGDDPASEKNVTAATAQYESSAADGVDEETVKVDLKARAILVEQGKDPDTCTAAEYAAACEKAGFTSSV